MYIEHTYHVTTLYFKESQEIHLESGIFRHTCKPSIWKAETRGPRIKGQPGLHSKFHTSLCYMQKDTCLTLYPSQPPHKCLFIFAVLLFQVKEIPLQWPVSSQPIKVLLNSMAGSVLLICMTISSTQKSAQFETIERNGFSFVNEPSNNNPWHLRAEVESCGISCSFSCLQYFPPLSDN